jgi:hypothetical protein
VSTKSSTTIPVSSTTTKSASICLSIWFD